MGKRQKTLKAIFDQPTRSGILWSDIESMLRAFGAELSEGRGSRCGSRWAACERSFIAHPRKETDKGSVESMRRFLTEAGITP